MEGLLDEIKDPGVHTAEWHGKTDTGETVPPGVYFVRIQAGEVELSQRIVRIR